jgi:hypothetical protein
MTTDWLDTTKVLPIPLGKPLWMACGMNWIGGLENRPGVLSHQAAHIFERRALPSMLPLPGLSRDLRNTRALEEGEPRGPRRDQSDDESWTWSVPPIRQIRTLLLFMSLCAKCLYFCP